MEYVQAYFEGKLASTKEKIPSKIIFKYEPSEKQAIAHMAEEKFVLYGGAMSGGKGATLDTKIITPFGPKRMGDIKVGDLVSTPDGTCSDVKAIWPQGIKKIYKVTFSDGSSTRVDGSHLWVAKKAMGKSKMNVALYTQDGKPMIKGSRIFSTEELKEHMDRRSTRKNPYAPLIPLTEPVQFTTAYRNKKASLPIHPYVLGVLLGDGCITGGHSPISISVGTDSAEIIDRIKELGFDDLKIHRNGGKNLFTVRFGNREQEIKSKLEKLGLLGTRSHTKFIPEAYSMPPLEDRWELVRGMMDTDGSVYKNGRRCSWASTSRQMADQFRWILMSLGFNVSIKTKQGWYYNDDREKVFCKDIHEFNMIQGRHKDKLFWLPRKANKVELNYNGQSFDDNPALRSMLSIEEDGEEETQCITISHPYGLYMQDDFIVTHNSFWGCAEGIQLSFDYPGNRGFICRWENSTLKRTTMITFFAILPPEAILYHNKNEQYIMLVNGSRIDYGGLRPTQIEKRREKVKSLELGWFFIDEATEVSEEMFSMLISRLRKPPSCKTPSLKLRGLLASNPEPGWVKERFVSQQLPNHRFVRALPTDNPYTGQEYVDGLKNDLPADMVEQYVYGNWDFDIFSPYPLLYPQSVLRAAIEMTKNVEKAELIKETADEPDDSPDDEWETSPKDEGDEILDEPLEEVIELGVDVAEGGGGDESVIAVRHNGFVEIALASREINPMELAIKVMKMAYDLNASLIKVDAIGVGAGVYHRLMEDEWMATRTVKFIAGAKAMDSKKFLNARAEAYWYFREKLEAGKVALPDDKAFFSQASPIRYRLRKSRLIQIEAKDEMKKRGLKSPDRVEAIVLAFAPQSIQSANDMHIFII